MRFELAPTERLARVVEIMAEGALALCMLPAPIMPLTIPILRVSDFNADTVLLGQYVLSNADILIDRTSSHARTG